MDDKIIYSVKPKFKLIYELFMPTGRKLKYNLFGVIFFTIIYFIYNNYINKINIIYINKIFNLFLICLIFLSISMFVFNLIYQFIKYSKMTYIFYNDKMIYEDLFLNQNKKEVMYSDIKEVELKRRVWDRINNQGIILLYSDAGNKYNNGIIMFAINDANNVYNRVKEIMDNYRK